MSTSPTGATSPAIIEVKTREKTLADELEEYKEAFRMFDTDQSGTISPEEIGVVLNAMGHKFTSKQLKLILDKFDKNHDGSIDFDEFVSLMKNHDRKEVDELQEAFNVFDKNRDGDITAKELEVVLTALGEPIDSNTLHLMVKAVDLNGDGTIDFKNFLK